MTGPAAGAGTPGVGATPSGTVDQALENAKKVDGKDGAGRDATQVVRDLTQAGVAPTSATASGHAALGSPGSTAEKVPSKGDDAQIKPDSKSHEQQPIGAQNELATFTTNGSIPSGTVPSPTGPVPAALIGDKEAADSAIKIAREGAVGARSSRKNSRFRISDDAAARLSPAELRAVAHDRGYGGVDGGRRAVLGKFLAAQKEDDSLQDPPEGHSLASSPTVPQSAVTGTLTTDRAGTQVGSGTVGAGTPTPAGALRNTDGSPANTSTGEKK